MWAAAERGESVDAGALVVAEREADVESRSLPLLTKAMQAEEQAESAAQWEATQTGFLKDYDVLVREFHSAHDAAHQAVAELVRAGDALTARVEWFSRHPARPFTRDHYSPLTAHGRRLVSVPVGDVVLALAGAGLEQAAGRPWGQYVDSFRMIRSNMVLPTGGK